VLNELNLERLPAPKAERIRREIEECDAIYRTRNDSFLDLSSLHYFHARMLTWAIEELGPSLAGRRVLDIGVGEGHSSVLLAQRGAHVTGIEVSNEALDRARRMAARYQVPVELRQMAGECLEFPDSTFDAVLCISAYHHMDQELASSEIARVLRPYGRVVFVEPLASNPPAWVYRRLARIFRRVATSHEKPLRVRDVEILRRDFSRVHWRGMFLLTTLMIYLDRIWDNTNPFVHRVTEKGFDRLRPLDEALMKIPLLGKIAWKICIVAER